MDLRALAPLLHLKTQVFLRDFLDDTDKKLALLALRAASQIAKAVAQSTFRQVLG